MSTTLLVHAFSCWFMTGVIWIVQALVYPFFKLVGENEFNRIHQFHMQRISWIVSPVMILELATGVLLYIQFHEALYMWNLLSVISIWLFTGLVNVPTHNKLIFQDNKSKFILVLYNWPRCILWTGRSLFLFWVLVSLPMELS